jgi:hypothetical protein
MKKALLLVIGLAAGFTCFASKRPPLDSVGKKRLINALNAFLVAKEGPNQKNPYVLKEDLPAMSAMLDELKGLDKNTKLKDNGYYRAYLNNIVDLSADRFLVQFSYIGISDKSAVLRATLRMIAKKRDTAFYFSSPLQQNTANWKTKKIGNINFHYKDTLSSDEAKNYPRYIDLFNKKLAVMPEPIEFYSCDNFPEALQILGIDYKSDYNGIRYDDLTAHENNITIEINGGYDLHKRFDRHDLWHDRLHMVIPVDTINRPVDEGCAYLYGGSWGKTWPEALALFKKFAAGRTKPDWLSLYMDDTNFYMDGQKTFKVSYAINALIVQKIEREHGFGAVKELLACGKRVPGDANYFKALERISGISTVNFNQVVEGLIHTE